MKLFVHLCIPETKKEKLKLVNFIFIKLYIKVCYKLDAASEV